MIRQRVVVHGHVQGVFFRDTCRREAASHQVAGWVRNLPDGTVEAVFEGEAQDVGAMTNWCRGGPAYARVEHVEVEEQPPTGQRGFEVR